MKNSILLFFTVFLLSVIISCNPKVELQPSGNYKEEIRKTEHDFKTTAEVNGIAEAFYRFADSSAVINRGNDSLITGRENIKRYYDHQVYQNATVDWEPDFIEVSETGDLGYSYGKYLWQIKDSTGRINEYRGIYMTVWKKQKDGTWKYVWD